MKFSTQALLSTTLTALLCVHASADPSKVQADLLAFGAIATSESPAFAAATTAAIAPISASRLFRRAGVVCETSDASPHYSGIDYCVFKLAGNGKNCEQQNGSGSFCTRMCDNKGADIAICGPRGDSMSCRQAAEYAQQVKNRCKRNSDGKAGGYYAVNSFRSIVIY
ncbi:hypothetical protein BJ508DRAFT_303729 [Ascobolus immersus RN42]|uniref:Uncharacterized protein n=1 Tax=Ascobolus immersus RN42 TaxID=1160509 RepID=A0A3N4ISP1_ASCIM|nr:hypothetical protein BJ508DRAFT_303729 [Ascobolus immersus RN42]